MITTATESAGKQAWSVGRWHEFAGRYRGLLGRVGDLVRDIPATSGLKARDINLLGRVHSRLTEAASAIEVVYDREARAGLTWEEVERIPGGPYLWGRISDGACWVNCRGRLPNRVPDLTRAEWVELGRTVKAIGRSIVALALELQTAKGVPIKLVDRIIAIEGNSFARFRTRMDDLVCAQHPDWPDATRVFYGLDEPIA